jgi:hypothetical protein
MSCPGHGEGAASWELHLRRAAEEREGVRQSVVGEMFAACYRERAERPAAEVQQAVDAIRAEIARLEVYEACREERRRVIAALPLCPHASLERDGARPFDAETLPARVLALDASATGHDD